MLIRDDFVFFHGTTVPTGPESCEFVADTYVSPDLDPERSDRGADPERAGRSVAVGGARAC